MSVRLRWVAQAQFAGIYVALDKGFYKDAGLDVKINPGGPNVNAETMVASGADTFAITGMTDAILFAREKDLPIVTIGMTLATSPYAFVAQEDAGINSVKDFAGKTMSAWFTGSQYQLYTALTNAGIDPSKETVVSQPFSMQPFIDGKYDISTVTTYNELLSLQEQNIPVKVFRADENGVRGQDGAIIASEETIKEKPEIVQAFLNATLKGWKDAIEHQDDAVNIILKHGTALNREHQVRMMAEYAKLATAGDTKTKGIGYVDLDAAKAVNESLVRFKALKAPQDVSAAFTNRFWDQVPAEDKRL
ncbi:ABC transporter substrate-binding protein (plasmid) [Rhizobium sp. CB3171]|uniref:ABC transporter substrate-binding protein n=1 Tax=Rhizobium sp. CB3171 TaxID=3039157 RepID=UPI0024B220E9|nr:ABC transporter substrate-binding protein [Rhizobium sp. CB3171]WFU06925.1 ABC transporter substrate-binding protein [Rhizobium sp. CB3171]